MTRYLLDVNVLLALSLPRHQHHAAATDWFDAGQQWATTPITETAYLRLMLNPRVVGYDIPASQALAALAAMRQLPGHSFAADTSSLAIPALDVTFLAGTNQVTDFHLVNLAVRNSMQFATFDASLSRALASSDRKHVFVLTD